ncbi:17-beta-hydroxysteroid dehydrogenase type 6 [Octodon degus]|uniref:17-beta-hydroxysteroid dehydrogenase type 6 n=1 Tax=Octodon degus TaxID=10160 RepID=A0A6P6DSP7_OCTDE|nr:17-beta-hydroxysteroid dehydrogenase type 6 [Octodon degus]XP_023563036.1 17-beta-hydroxysteroid dehydrogenase type 6 [Octodon degus]XP_023563037.1 17-beta-hydroxysteroid dehydrogenase type 6 [Octodon degus]
MWLYLAALVGLYHLVRWYRERQVVSNLQDKYVFITGCDSGFGNLLARQLDMRGLRVLAACLTEEGAEQLRKRTSGRLQTVILDVTQTESIAAATEWVKECVGDRGLWGLVNNAGTIGRIAVSEWYKMEHIVNVFKVNLFGLAEVTLSMLPLVRRARGRIVNVSSILGRVATAPSPYSSSKYGVEAFSDTLRRELKEFGVKVSIVAPGFFNTGMANVPLSLEQMKQCWEETPAHIKESYGQKYFDVYCNVINQMMSCSSSDLYLVTDCMEHALTSVHPRTRYSGGWDAKFFYIPLSYLPTSVVDYIISRF